MHHSTKKKQLSPRESKPAAASFSSSLFDRLLEIVRTLKNFDGKLSRGEVHRLRVATRRLRAVFEVLGEAKAPSLKSKARKSVKFLTNQLGEIRSLDVSLKLWRQRFSFPFVESELKNRANRARKRMARHMGKKIWASLEKSLQKILRQLRRGQASYRLAWEKRRELAERRARRCYSVYRAKGSIESLHELRIRFKQWRYLLELAPANSTRLGVIELLKALQDDIGELHDMDVLREMLKTNRVKRVAQREKAGHDLKEIRRGLEAEIETGQKSFLARQSQALAQVFPKEKA